MPSSCAIHLLHGDLSSPFCCDFSLSACYFQRYLNSPERKTEETHLGCRHVRNQENLLFSTNPLFFLIERSTNSHSWKCVVFGSIVRSLFYSVAKSWLSILLFWNFGHMKSGCRCMSGGRGA